MRTLARFTFPVERGNQAVKDGTLKSTLEKLMARLQPEAAYFLPSNGMRSALIVFDLKDPSDIPSIVEPLFSGLNATVEFTPVMNSDDLRAGLEKLAAGP